MGEIEEFGGRWGGMDVVLAHDWLTGMRGGERVLELLCRVFPRAPIATLLCNRAAVSRGILTHEIRTSFLQGIPGVMRRYRSYLPLFPAAVEWMRLPPADLVVSTSHCVAKGVRPAGEARHLCYCFTPMRYAWCFYEEYFGRNPWKALLVKPLLARMRRWDRQASARVTRFVAISEHVRGRIRAFYGRDADVVHPPVTLGYWTPGEGYGGEYDLVVSALVPYKRVDLVVEAYNRMGRRLKVAGVGTERRALEAAAGKNIEFLGWQSDASLRELYRGCRMLVFPGEEDFGLVPLEAQACGRPVVAYARGGTLETIVDGETGVFFREQTVDDVEAAVRRCEALSWDRGRIREQAERFSVARFLDGMSASIEACLSAQAGG